MSVRERMETKLREALAPESLDIIDESHLHKGHVGARPEGETHFRAIIVAQAFEGLDRVARQKKVYQILADELAGPVHALTLRLSTPGDAEQA